MWSNGGNQGVDAGCLFTIKAGISRKSGGILCMGQEVKFVK
ncbi:hypothetical protein [Gimesia benthica]|nr:hypothetical protein [Gimesia benthica]